MKNNFANVRGKVWRFLLRHPVSCALFCFLFIAGAAAGGQLALALSDIAELASRLREGGVPFLYCALISVCVCAFIMSMLVLSGIWVPAAILWPMAILLRGAVTGAAFKLAYSFFPQAPAFWLTPLLLIETALILPPFIKIAAISGELLAASLKSFAGGPQFEPQYSYFLAPCAALVPGLIIQSVAAPIALYLFC